MRRTAGANIHAQLEHLQALTQAAVDEELALGPAWIADASLEALGKIRVLRATAGIDLALLPKGADLRTHLGADWVDLHDTVYDLVDQISKTLYAMQVGAG